MKNLFNVKENNRHHLKAWSHLPCLFWMWTWLTFPLGWLLHIQVITINPAPLSSPDMTFKRNFLSYLAWSCRSLCIKSQLCFWSSFSIQGTNIEAFHFTFVSVVKMFYHAPYDRPRILRIPLFLGRPSWSMTSCTLLTFLLGQLNAGQSEDSKSSTKCWSLWNMHTIQRVVVYPWHHNKRLFEAIHKSQKLVFQGYNTTWCNFSVL
jgi:hypothetical protein